MHHIPRSKYTFEELIAQSRAVLSKQEDSYPTEPFVWSCIHGEWIPNPRYNK